MKILIKRVNKIFGCLNMDKHTNNVRYSHILMFGRMRNYYMRLKMYDFEWRKWGCEMVVFYDGLGINSIHRKILFKDGKRLIYA